MKKLKLLRKLKMKIGKFFILMKIQMKNGNKSILIHGQHGGGAAILIKIEKFPWE